MDKCIGNESCIFKNSNDKCHIGNSIWGTCRNKNPKIKVIYKKRKYEDKKNLGNLPSNKGETK